MAMIRIEGFEAAYSKSSRLNEAEPPPSTPLTIWGFGAPTFSTDPVTSSGRLGGLGVSLGYLSQGTGFHNASRVRMYPAFESSSNTLIMGWAGAFTVLDGTAGRIYIENAFGSGNHIETLPTDILRVRVNGSTYNLGITTAEWPVSSTSWRYVECKVFFDATVGTVEWKVGGVTTATYTGLNTGAAPTLWTPNFGGTDLVTSTGQWRFDDIYVCDGSGATNNDFLGDLQILPLNPIGEGVSSALVGSDTNSVDNHLLVDERSLNTVDYVQSATQGHKDTYDVNGITYVGAGTSSTSAAGLPTNSKTGDLLILMIESGANGGIPTPPPTGGDWTLAGSIPSFEDGAGDRTRMTAYWAWYNASINRTVSGGSDHTLMQIFAFRNVHPTTPFDVASTTGANSTNSTSHSAATGQTSVTNRAMAVLAAGHGSFSGTMGNQDNTNLGTVFLGATPITTAIGNDGQAALFYGRAGAAGAIGTFTWDTQAVANENAWVAMVLRPNHTVAADNILCVQTTASIARSDVSGKYVRMVLRSNSVDYVGPSQLAETVPDYQPMLELWEVDPNTSVAWTESGAGSIEVGVEVRDS